MPAAMIMATAITGTSELLATVRPAVPLVTAVPVETAAPPFTTTTVWEQPAASAATSSKATILTPPF